MKQFQIQQVRNDTAGGDVTLHFNNAGASLSPTQVINAQKNYLDLEASMGGYEAAQLKFSETEKFYDSAAHLINCTRDEIAYAENATRAWDMIFYSRQFKKGDRIITSQSEYVSNYLAFLHRAKQIGMTIDVIKNDSNGQLDLDELSTKLNTDVKLIAITHVPSHSGVIHPVAEVGKLAMEWNIPYLLDATQSVGQMPVDVAAIGCDFLCATGRKFLRGPRGTGFLFVKKTKITECDPPFVDVHNADWVNDNDYIVRSDARRFETWEQNVAAKLGLAVAIDYALDLDVSIIWNRIRFLANHLRQQLADIPAVTLQDLGKNTCGIVTFTCQNLDAIEVQKKLQEQKINVGVVMQKFARLDMGKRNLPDLVRASVHYYNTENEIERFVKAIHQLY